LAYSGLALRTVIGLMRAFLAKKAAFSIVPPMPMPITIGGQGLGPAALTVSTANFLIPATPADGENIFNALIFSLPKPLGARTILILSPGTMAT
jgi:hypothetical protein